MKEWNEIARKLSGSMLKSPEAFFQTAPEQWQREDVARANLLALEGEWRGFQDYNVGTGRGTDVNQLEAGLRQALAEVLREHGRGTCAPASWMLRKFSGNWTGARR